MADQYQLTASSTARDKAEASRQLGLAQQEWRNFLNANRTYQDVNGSSIPVFGAGWRQKAEPKLQEILQRYPYVSVYTDEGKLVTDRLTIKTDGSITIPNFEQFTPTGNQAPDRDDAYAAVADAKTLPKPNITGTHPADPSKATQTSIQPNGSSAVDSPDLAGSTTKAAKPATTQQPVTGVDPGSTSPANEVPVTTTPGTQSDSSAQGQAARLGGDPTAPNNNSQVPGNDDSGSQTTSTQVADTTGTTGTSGSVTVGSTTSTSSASGGTPANRKMKVRNNVLHDYANWTYQIGFYMLEIDTYNQFVQSGADTAGLRKHTILRSGGFIKNNDGLQKDLYVTRMVMEGVIGNNKASPGANQYLIEMDVLEPYGANFIAELANMARSLPSQPQYHFGIPYLLEIKFLGYDDLGKPVPSIPNSGPKLVPCKIVNITFNISAAGTTYNITMVPTPMEPQTTQYGYVRENLRLYGRNLQEMLVSGPDSLAERLNQAEKRNVSDGLAEFADEYKFKVVSFDPSRAETDTLLNSPVTFEMQGGSITAMGQRGLLKNDPTATFLSFTGGTPIRTICQRAAMYTKYFADKIKPNAPDQDKSSPMELIKVVPTVEYNKWDRKRQTYQKKITFKVMPYFVYGELYPWTGQAPVQQGVLIKDYNYIFTGKNQDIINADLQYDVTYFRVFEKAFETKGYVETGAETVNDRSPPQGKDNTTTGFAYAGRSGETTLRASRGVKDISVQEYFNQQLNSTTNSDLAVLDLTIIGDPDWIGQDRSIRPVGDSVVISQDGFINGSIATDVESVYVRVTFKTPQDYDDKTGLMKLTNNNDLVSGIYKVATVRSTFENGKFTQVLEMIRVPNQEENKPNPNSSSGGGARDFNEIARRNAAFSPSNLVAPAGPPLGMGSVTTNPAGTPVVQRLPASQGNSDDA